MKKGDFIFIGIVLILGLAALFGVRWIAASQKTGEAFAKVYYRDELILLIDLSTCEYDVFDTPYADLVITTYAAEGIFYVPGTTTLEPDPEDSRIDVPRVRLEVDKAAASITVAYQESPRDVCELQGATDSSLKPLVCLPNELVVTVITNETADHFVLDGDLS